MQLNTKFIAGKRMIPGTITIDDDKIWLGFRYNKILLEEVKAFEGAKWNPTTKNWVIKNTPRNQFQLAYLQGLNPYARFDTPLREIETARKLYNHQKLLVNTGVTRKVQIFASEMGCLHADTPLRCELTGLVQSIQDWHESGTYPLLKCYNLAGDIVTQYPRRIFTKMSKMVKITTTDFTIIVGEKHTLLSGGKLCLASALQIGSTIGMLTTFPTSQLSNKHTGMGTSTEMEVPIISKQHSKPNCHQLTSMYCDALQETSNTLVTMIPQRSISLGANYSNSQSKRDENSQNSKNLLSHTLFEDCSTLMVQSPSATTISEFPISMSRFATLPGTSWLQSLRGSIPGSLRGTALTKFRSMVEAEFNNSEIIYTETPLVSWNEKSRVFERRGTIHTIAESAHFTPISFHNFVECKITGIEYLDKGTVYDLTIPQYGNYFDAYGVSHQNTGKSLAAIEIMEATIAQSGFSDWWWIAPKSALNSTRLELIKWKAKIRPQLHTYESLKKTIQNWPPGKKAPRGVVFDESSRLKNPTAQRSQAAMELANGIREDWGDEAYILLMSGTPAPKSPADWWYQCEIACPGFLREGTIEKFKKRLGLIVYKESMQGGSYPELITWKDDENKCDTCGQPREHPDHDTMAMVTGGNYHTFVPSVNEVAYLYERMKGLVTVLFKKDCLDLPDKRYEVINVKPTQSTLRAASIITAKSKTVVGAMTLLRELSDGFQYQEEESGTTTCSLCKGKGEIIAPVEKTSGSIITVTEFNIERLRNQYPDLVEDIVVGSTFKTPEPELGYVEVTDDNLDEIQAKLPNVEVGMSIDKGLLDCAIEVRHKEDVSADEEYEDKLIGCPKCGGSGETTTYKREIVEVACPKDDVVRELLDRYSDVGRTVWYGGFSGSVERLIRLARKDDWHVVRVDGRGYWCSWAGNVSSLDMLRTFQEGSTEAFPRVAFIGQPSAAGMGLTLTASPMICFYSNDFNAESRQQAEDRIHRIGMDVNRGATIYDICHLPTDQKVLDNLNKKRKLQSMSMGELRDVLSNLDQNAERKF